MKRQESRIRSRWFVSRLGVGAILALLLNPGIAAAHCDTLDGPVVMNAKEALKSGDVTPVLKWFVEQLHLDSIGQSSHHE